MRRTCKACGSEFDLAYRRGRPREHCYRCQPEGTRMLGAIKLMNLRDEERSMSQEMSRAGRTTTEVVGAASMSGAYRGLAAAAGMTFDE